MKRILTLLICGLATAANSQTADSVSIGPSYVNRAFYSLYSGEIGAQQVNNIWDLAIAVYTLQTASIRINGGFGVQVFQYDGGDTTHWAALDTAGLYGNTTWKRCYDSDTSYEPSAFEYHMTGFPNYGWGVYNTITHDVVGVKLFVVKTVAGDFKKVWIKKQSAMTNSITVRVASLDNSLDNTTTISKNASGQNFVYLNLGTLTTTANDPSNSTYDLIFNKYEEEISPDVYYPVTGVWINRNVKVAEARGVHIDDADFEAFPRDENLSQIGSDWKAFNMMTFQWELEDSLSYFVEDLTGNIWQIWFTKFGGSSTGKFVFNKRQLTWAKVENENGLIAQFNVYPNPATEFVNVVFTMNTQSSGNISLFGLDGRKIHSAQVNNSADFNSYQLNIHALGLTSGIYLIRLEVGSESAVQRLVIQ